VAAGQRTCIVSGSALKLLTNLVNRVVNGRGMIRGRMITAATGTPTVPGRCTMGARPTGVPRCEHPADKPSRDFANRLQKSTTTLTAMQCARKGDLISPSVSAPCASPPLPPPSPDSDRNLIPQYSYHPKPLPTPQASVAVRDYCSYRPKQSPLEGPHHTQTKLPMARPVLSAIRLTLPASSKPQSSIRHY